MKWRTVNVSKIAADISKGKQPSGYLDKPKPRYPHGCAGCGKDCDCQARSPECFLCERCDS